MLYPPDRKVGDWPRQRHVPSLQVRDQTLERVGDGGVHRAAVRIARTEHEVVDEHLRAGRRTKMSPTKSMRPDCSGGARRRRGDTPLRGRGPPRVESCAWLRRKGRGDSRRIPARATFAAARCRNVVRWTPTCPPPVGDAGSPGHDKALVASNFGAQPAGEREQPLRDPHTNDARQAELTRWRAPRQQRNQPFSLRLLDELVVVPVHTFVKVHWVAHEASSSTFGVWFHTFVRSPTQSFCAYAG